jgi:hypothetical protein
MSSAHRSLPDFRLKLDGCGRIHPTTTIILPQPSSYHNHHPTTTIILPQPSSQSPVYRLLSSLGAALMIPLLSSMQRKGLRVRFARIKISLGLIFLLPPHADPTFIVSSSTSLKNQSSPHPHRAGSSHLDLPDFLHGIQKRIQSCTSFLLKLSEHSSITFHQ